MEARQKWSLIISNIVVLRVYNETHDLLPRNKLRIYTKEEHDHLKVILSYLFTKD